MGVFCKKWTFPQHRVHYVQYQYLFILHFTYLGGGGSYAPHRRPAYVREHVSSIASVTVCVKRIATMQLGCCQWRSSAGMPRH